MPVSAALPVTCPAGNKVGKWSRIGVLIELEHQGLIRCLGLSNRSPKQIGEARKLTEIVCVQNEFNPAQRRDDRLIDDLAGQDIACVP